MRLSINLRFNSGKLPASYTPASGTPLEQVKQWRYTLNPFFEVWPLARLVSRIRFGRVRGGHRGMMTNSSSSAAPRVPLTPLGGSE